MIAPNLTPTRRRFRLGKLVATSGALEALKNSGQDPLEFVARHMGCDWGAVCPADWRANDDAVAHEGDPDRQCRVLSVYTTRGNETLWIITEADRSATTILLPEEY